MEIDSEEREAVAKVHEAIRAVDDILFKLGIIQDGANRTGVTTAALSDQYGARDASTSDIPSSAFSSVLGRSIDVASAQGSAAKLQQQDFRLESLSFRGGLSDIRPSAHVPQNTSSIASATPRITEEQVAVPLISNPSASPFSAQPAPPSARANSLRNSRMGPDRSRADQVRLGVRLIQIDMRPSAREGMQARYGYEAEAEEEEEGRSLGIDPDPKLTASIIDPQCIVKCEEVRKVSRPASSIHNDSNEAEGDENRPGSSSTAGPGGPMGGGYDGRLTVKYDEFFVFQIISPAFAVLRVKVLGNGGLACGQGCLGLFKEIPVGEFRVPITSISDARHMMSQPTWHNLKEVKRGGRKGAGRGRFLKVMGKVQLQIYYIDQRILRPLKILTGTWNVGNAQPPDMDLLANEWLTGVRTGDYDLVAIGVQECAYKPKRRALSQGAEAPRSMHGEDDEDDEEDEEAEEGWALGSMDLTGPKSSPSPEGSHHHRRFNRRLSVVTDTQAGPSSPQSSLFNPSGSVDLRRLNRKSADMRRSLETKVVHRSLRKGLPPDAKLEALSESQDRSDGASPSQRVSPFSSVLHQLSPFPHIVAKRSSAISVGADGDSSSFPFAHSQSSNLTKVRQARFDEDHPGKEQSSGRLSKLFGVSPSQSSQSNLQPTVAADSSAAPQRSNKAGQAGRAPSKLVLSGVDIARTLSLKSLAGGMSGSTFRDLWENEINDAVGEEYSLVKSAHMGQMRLLVFARNDICAAISHAERGMQATGVAGVATNKGGVAVGFRLWDTDICFVNSHLAAHQDKLKARNDNYRDICRGIRGVDQYNMDLLTGFHHVFWLGDLNYRLDWGSQATNPTESPTREDFESLVEAIGEGRYAELLEKDQLIAQMKEKKAFLGFAEPPIDFPCTFKVERAAVDPKYKKQRSPAYCDRILYRSNLPHKVALPLEYYYAPGITSSDHKPVGAVFSVPMVNLTYGPSSSAPHGSSHQGSDNQLRLTLKRVSLEGLSVLKKRTTGKIVFPNPYLIISSRSLRDPSERHLSSTVHNSRSPSWLDLVLDMKPIPIAELEDHRLMVKIMDNQSENTQHHAVLGRFVLPLVEAAQLVNRQYSRLQTGEELKEDESVIFTADIVNQGLLGGTVHVEFSFKLPDNMIAEARQKLEGVKASAKFRKAKGLVRGSVAQMANKFRQWTNTEHSGTSLASDGRKGSMESVGSRDSRNSKQLDSGSGPTNAKGGSSRIRRGIARIMSFHSLSSPLQSGSNIPNQTSIEGPVPEEEEEEDELEVAQREMKAKAAQRKAEKQEEEQRVAAEALRAASAGAGMSRLSNSSNAFVPLSILSKGSSSDTTAEGKKPKKATTFNFGRPEGRKSAEANAIKDSEVLTTVKEEPLAAQPDPEYLI